MSKKTLKHESYQDSTSIQLYLEEILAGLKKGTLKIATGDDQLELSPNGLLQLQVSASAKKSRQQLSMKISWTPENAPNGEKDDQLTVQAH